jgi:hypothetical protein
MAREGVSGARKGFKRVLPLLERLPRRSRPPGVTTCCRDELPEATALDEAQSAGPGSFTGLAGLDRLCPVGELDRVLGEPLPLSEGKKFSALRLGVPLAVEVPTTSLSELEDLLEDEESDLGTIEGLVSGEGNDGAVAANDAPCGRLGCGCNADGGGGGG